MVKPNIKYRVTLTLEEREFLRNLVQKGNTAGFRIRHAQLSLALDEIQANESWTDEKLGKAYDVHMLVMDNLNTHSPASLYAAFEPEMALRLCERFEIQRTYGPNTPKHASWLNMAELEIGVMSLKIYITNK